MFKNKKQAKTAPVSAQALDPVNCTECGIELEGEDDVFIYGREPVCGNCCRDRIEEEFDISYIAKALGIATKSAEDYAAEQQQDHQDSIGQAIQVVDKLLDQLGYDA